MNAAGRFEKEPAFAFGGSCGGNIAASSKQSLIGGDWLSLVRSLSQRATAFAYLA
jgi:hypothetical protein